jgi:hypothetical protein
VAYGNKVQRETDYSGSGQNRLEFTRTYNYMGADTGPSSLNGALGSGWTHTYERRLKLFSNSAIRAGRPDGEDRIFLPVTGGYQEFGTSTERLNASKDGSGNIIGWTFIDANDGDFISKRTDPHAFLQYCGYAD